jgi:hypothetical protein
MARMMKDSEEKGESCSCGSSSCKKCGGTVKSKYADGGMLASKGPKMRGQGSASAMTHKMVAQNAAAKPARDAARKARMDARRATAAAARTASDATKAAARKARYTTMKEAYKAKQEATKPQRDAARKVKMDELRAKRAADPTFSLNRNTSAKAPGAMANPAKKMLERAKPPKFGSTPVGSMPKQKAVPNTTPRQANPSTSTMKPPPPRPKDLNTPKPPPPRPKDLNTPKPPPPRPKDLNTPKPPPPRPKDLKTSKARSTDFKVGGTVNSRGNRGALTGKKYSGTY